MTNTIYTILTRTAASIGKFTVPIFFAAAISSPGVILADSPAATVNTYHDALIRVAESNRGQDMRTRIKFYTPLMDAAFHYSTMIKTAAGRYWRRASDAQRDGLLSVFRRVVIATNADRFSALRDAKFETAGTRDGPRSTALVDSFLITDSDRVKLTYVLRETDQGWRIIDVLLDGGISELAVRASEYAAPLRDGGVDKLISSLEDQEAELSAN